jgi:phosphate/sulfate permease
VRGNAIHRYLLPYHQGGVQSEAEDIQAFATDVLFYSFIEYMKTLHEKAMKHSQAYADWHKQELTELLSWVMFFAMAYMAFNVVSFEADRTLAMEMYAMQNSSSQVSLAASSTQ